MNDNQYDIDRSLADSETNIVEEGNSEVSALLYQAFSDATKDMERDEAAHYLATVFEDRTLETERIFERISTEKSSQLPVTNYHPDRAMREASLAHKEDWKSNGEGEFSYIASNTLEVYLGTKGQPLDIRDALKEIRKLSESTVLTGRILLGLWNVRRYNNQQVSKDGSVAILLDEILQWQGIQKHSRVAHPGTGTTKRYTDGYRTEQKQRVLQDLALLASCHVRGTCTMIIRGKATPIEVDGPYIRYDTVSRKTIWDEKVILGFLVSPGGWIGTYEQHQVSSFAHIDSQIFTLNPQNDRYALRLALYLAERWREQAKDGNFSTPLIMSDLLAASMIDVDKRHLTADFAPAIEKALLKLEKMSVIGKQMCITGFHVGVDEEQTHTCMRMHLQPGKEAHSRTVSNDACLTASAHDQARWGKEWLASRWEILPPLELIHAYQALTSSPKKRNKKVIKKA